MLAKTVASGGNAGREAQLYEQYSEHRKPAVQRAAGSAVLLGALARHQRKAKVYLARRRRIAADRLA